MYKRYTILAIIFSVCLIASNLFDIKIFTAGPITLTGGILIFPIVYVINDCITEVFGYEKTKNVIWTAFAINVFFVLMSQLVLLLPPAPYWDGQDSMDYIFAADSRITAASMAAFVVGSIINAKVMDKMRRKDGDRKFGWRAMLSTLMGETADSLVFFPIAFYHLGISRILVLMVTQIILKTGYELIVLPLTKNLVQKMKEHQRV